MFGRREWRFILFYIEHIGHHITNKETHDGRNNTKSHYMTIRMHGFVRICLYLNQNKIILLFDLHFHLAASDSVTTSALMEILPADTLDLYPSFIQGLEDILW